MTIEWYLIFTNAEPFERYQIITETAEGITERYAIEMEAIGIVKTIFTCFAVLILR